MAKKRETMNTSLRTFIVSMFTKWTTAMSGGLGIPLTVLGIFASGKIQRVTLLATGALSLGSAAFLMWKEERFGKQLLLDNLNDNESNYKALLIEWDAANTLREFHSREQWRDPMTGKSQVYKESRVKVWNKSRKTVFGVKVTTRSIGVIPQRPHSQKFEVNNADTYDIDPFSSALVPVARGPIEPLAGMPCGPSAAEVYGPIEVTVTGRDVAPVVRIFQFDWQLEAMLYD